MLLRSAVLCIWIVGLLASDVAACKYNVRDIGFVDLDDSAYGLLCFVDDDVPEDLIAAITEVSNAALLESNVHPEVINVDSRPDHPAISFLPADNVSSFPLAFLVSTDADSLQVSLPEAGEGFRTSLWSLCESITSSQMTRQIAENACRTFGVVLLIEGDDIAANALALTQIKAAIDTITDQMSMMPKPVSNPPVLLTVPAAQRIAEKTLLWSLGLDSTQQPFPHVAVLYGKARRMGHLLAGEEITESRLARLLTVIGSDCECGLDRYWLHGKMIPVAWDSRLEQILADQLDFDPQNPMVKREVSQILRFGGTGQRTTPNVDSLPMPAFGYQEIVVDFDTAPEQNSVDETVEYPDLQVSDDSHESLQQTQGQAATSVGPLRLIIPIAGLVVAAGFMFAVLRVRKTLP